MTTPEIKLKQTPLPDVGDIIFVALIYLTLYLLPNFVFGDGSTGWHIATGEWVLKHGIPDSNFKDLFSWTFPNQHWVAYEWLSDTVMAAITSIGGLPLLAVVTDSVIALLFLLLYERSRKEGCHFGTVLVVTILGALTSSVHWLARPHLFTFFGVYIFTTRLEDRYQGKISKLAFFLPLILYMLIWANSHPAFLIGLALIGLYAVCSLIAALVYAAQERRLYLDKARDFILAGIGCALVTLLNPFGFGLYTYIFKYLKGNVVIQATEEYLSPNFHGAMSPACLEILFALFIIGLNLSKRRLTFPSLMTCLVFAYLALSSVRHMPLFTIVALPAICSLLGSVRPISYLEKSRLSESQLDYIPIANWWKATVAKAKEIGDGFNENEAICQMHLLPILTVVVLASITIFAPNSQLITSNFDPKSKPWFETDLKNIETNKNIKTAGTLNYLFDKERSSELKPEEGLATDNWGGYLFYTASKQNPPIVQKVFIDDRADFYGEDHYKKFAIVSQVEPGYEKVLRDAKINWILFPYNSRLVAALKQNPAWLEVSHDKASNLFVRKSRI